jgi:hypothetical protein
LHRAARGVNARRKILFSEPAPVGKKSLTLSFHAGAGQKFFAVREKIQSRSAALNAASAWRALARSALSGPAAAG